jgi:hypothetical protein
VATEEYCVKNFRSVDEQWCCCYFSFQTVAACPLSILSIIFLAFEVVYNNLSSLQRRTGAAMYAGGGAGVHQAILGDECCSATVKELFDAPVCCGVHNCCNCSAFR